MFVSLTLTALASLGMAADWPGFLGPAGDGRSTETGLNWNWPQAGPPLLWQHDLGEGYAAPAIADGTVFVFDRHGSKARLTALDAADGSERWRSEYETAYTDLYQFSNGPRSAPVVDGDRVYTFGAEGILRCHKSSNGKLLWQVDTTDRFGVVQNFFGVGSTPVIEGALLIAIVGGSPSDSPQVLSGKVKPAGSGIVAFDKLTGEVHYAVADELASYASPVLRTIGDRRWGLAFMRGGLIGFEPATGKIDFSFPWRARKLESVNAASPVVVDDRVFLTESYEPGSALLRVRPGGYELLRKDENRRGSMRSHWATPVHDRGTLYGCSGSGSGDAELRAVELDSGKLLWSEKGLGRSTVIYADGHLVVLGEFGDVLAVKATPEKFVPVSRAKPMLPAADGEKPRALLDQPAWSPPALADGQLYLRGKSRLACFSLKK